MNYHDHLESGQAATQAKSLLGDASRVIERLSDIHGRLAKVHDVLHGSQPRPSEANAIKQAGAPSPMPTVRGGIDYIHALACDIDSELQRIEARL